MMTFHHPLLKVALLLTLIGAFFDPVAAQTPTADQIRKFQQLPPDQQAKAVQAIKSAEGKGASSQALSEPEVVKSLPEPTPLDLPTKSTTDALVSTLKDKRSATTVRQALRPFGYELFEGVPTTFAPATDIPVPADYVIGPGDTVMVQLYGKENQEYELTVSREGLLQFPSIGPISVAGLKFEQLQKLIGDRIERQMIGVKVSTSMGPLRSIRVFILGDARRPGSYTVSALSTITHALFVSGGITTMGSLRNIELKRSGNVVKRIDLYDLLLRGDTSGDARLLPGDVIFVPPLGPTVGVVGEVRRPAIYELRQERTIQEALELAGGMLPTAYPEASQMERINAHRERTLMDLDISKAAGSSVLLKDGDTLRVYSILEKMEDIVLLSGHVDRPGGYQWREGLRLTDVIPNLETLLPRPDLDYVMIQRELPPDRRIEILSTRLGHALVHPDSIDNIVLQPRDEIVVFGLNENRAETIKPIIEQLKQQARHGKPERVVTISGNVSYPGEYPIELGMRVADLIRAGGGLGQQAYTLDAELVRYDVIEGRVREVTRQAVNLKAITSSDATHNIELRSFDVLNVKQIPEWRVQQIVDIVGEVKFPGEYVMQRGETLRQVIERAGGFSSHAFKEGAVFTREDLRVKEQTQLDQLRDKLKADLAAISLQQSQEKPENQQAATMAQGLLSQLETAKALGRLVIDLPAIMAGNLEDVILQNGDKLIVPTTPQEVTVLGEVHYPTSHLYQSDLSQDEYIKRSGGQTYKADRDRMYVVRANGEVRTAGGGWFGGGRQAIYVGDTIVVPLDAERMRPLVLWTSVTQVLYQLALSAAAFNAVGVF